MDLTDIFQLVLLCAVIFIPLGFISRRYVPRLRALFRTYFVRPRYVKSAGILHRHSVKADQQHD